MYRSSNPRTIGPNHANKLVYEIGKTLPVAIINFCPLCGKEVSAKFPERDGWITMENTCIHCNGIYGTSDNPVFHFTTYSPGNGEF